MNIVRIYNRYEIAAIRLFELSEFCYPLGYESIDEALRDMGLDSIIDLLKHEYGQDYDTEIEGCTK